MIIHGIDQLTKKDIPLYYRNEYAGLGDMEFPGGERKSIPLEFTVEIKPTGERVIAVTLKDRIEYPLVPVIRELKNRIGELEKDGKLR